MAAEGDTRKGRASLATLRVVDNRIDKGHHDEIVVSVSAGDWAEWSCMTEGSSVTDFEVTDFRKMCRYGEKCPHPDFPFASKDPQDPARARSFTAKVGSLLRSGKGVDAAAGHTYKFTWKVYDAKGTLIDSWDPHLRVDP